jgi:nucleotide-binding universal stress UspA family protein
LFETAADQRRDAGDTRAMARLLAETAALAEAQGRREAAGDLYWRAGRSALREGDPAADAWLARAAALGVDGAPFR